jgi:hypothetical protein
MRGSVCLYKIFQITLSMFCMAWLPRGERDKMILVQLPGEGVD